jgi:hypothetical protein
MVALPISIFSQTDHVAGQLLQSLKAGVEPDGYVDAGRWNPVVAMAMEAFENAEHAENRGQIVGYLLDSLIKSGRYPGLENILSSFFDVPSVNGHSPQPLTEVEQPDPKFPMLPESATLPESLSDGASGWLDEYVKYSKLVSPEGYSGFHTACGLWILSTVAARRVRIPFNRKQYTPLMIALVARTSLYAKSNTAEAAISVLQAAGLRFLLGSDETTPQKLLSDMAGNTVPRNYENLEVDKQYWIQRRLALAAQRGWFYDEFGSLLRAMARNGGIMQDFKGLLLKLDNCADQYEYATQARGVELIEKPYLSLLGTMTPADMRSGAKSGSDLWSDGFLARFTFICPPPDTSIDAPFTLGEVSVPYSLFKPLRDWHERLGEPTISLDEEKDKKERVTGYAVNRGHLPETKLEFGEGVYDAWACYRSALKSMLKQLPSQDFDGSYNRLSIKAIRIAALLASLENNDLIEMKHWARAQEIAEEWRLSLHQLYSQINSHELEASYAKHVEDDVLRVVKKLEEQGKPPTIRDLSRYLTRTDVGKIKMVVTDMVRTNLLSEDKSGKSSRYTVAEEEENEL